MTLAGRVAIVTGASRGIGAAIAERLGAEGATVAIVARSLSSSIDGLAGTLADTAARIRAHGSRALPVAADLTDPAERARVVDTVLDACGQIDILVNAAGRAMFAPIGGFTAADVLAQTQQYVVAPFDLTRLALPALRANGAGWVVNIGSNSAQIPAGPPWSGYTTGGGAALYAGLKAAVVRTSVSLAAELARDGISVNVVAPVSAVRTPGLEALGIRTDNVEPVEHLAEAVVDLVSADPRAVTGKVVTAQGHLAAVGRSTRSLDGRTVVVERGTPPEAGSPVFVVDELVSKPGRAREVLDRYAAEYVPGARARGMRLRQTLVSPPTLLADGSNTIQVTWEVDGLDGWWRARAGGRDDAVTGFWDGLALCLESRSRRHYAAADDLAVLDDVR
ncbi:MAG TPA: SDR family oxidoreductase [Asanoa sp.]|jgi:NAD(P)-dependent dehydrogenase (short-subunit alcohol dehydrogenase family)|nr:SDR family oxidoreductase [Asanoa sp.]